MVTHSSNTYPTDGELGRAPSSKTVVGIRSWVERDYPSERLSFDIIGDACRSLIGVSGRIPLKELVNRLHETDEGRMWILLQNFVADGECQADDGALKGK
jgi:hypothetical protein